MPNASSRSQFELSKLQRAVRTHFLARRPREEGVSSLRLSGKHAPLQRAAGALLGIALAPSAEIFNSQRLKAGSEFAGRRQHPLGVTQQPLHQQVRTTAPISSQVVSTCRSQQEGSARRRETPRLRGSGPADRRWRQTRTHPPKGKRTAALFLSSLRLRKHICFDISASRRQLWALFCLRSGDISS